MIELATDKQIWRLKQMGQYTEGMTKKDAHKIIDVAMGGSSKPEPKDVTSQFVPKNDLDNRQKSIVRQSSLRASVEFFREVKDCPTQDVLALAEVFENWVNR